MRAFFIANRSIQDKLNEDISNEIIPKRIHDAEWLDVIALFAAILFSEGRIKRTDDLVKVLLKVEDNASLQNKAATLERVFQVFRYVPVNYKLENVQEYLNMAKEVMAIFDPTESDKISLKDRYEVAVELSVFGALQLLNVTPTMVYIEAGAVVVGAQANNPNGLNYDERASSREEPVSVVFSRAFDIGRYPVTIHEYEKFIDKGGYDLEQNREYWSDEGLVYMKREDRKVPVNWDVQSRYPNFPVTWINVYEAEAYCRWLTKNKADNMTYRLPSEDEWEFAARRQDKEYQAYSWGNEPKNLNSIFGFNRLLPVGLFVEDCSQSGLCDLSCNISEWTLDPAGHERKPGQLLAMHYFANEKTTRDRIIKGGNYRNYEQTNRSSVRSGKQSGVGCAYVGFRVSRHPNPPNPIEIKGELPQHQYPSSLVDYYEYYTHQCNQKAVNRQESLNEVLEGLGNHIETFLSSILPSNYRERRLWPCRLGDHPTKFDFNLRYQDSRIKIACEKRYSDNNLNTKLIQEIELRQRAVACILAFPQDGHSRLWEDINDNDLDAIVFSVLNYFEPHENSKLFKRGISKNNIALSALPTLHELRSWGLEKLIKYQIFAGVQLLNTTECNLERQFEKMGDFRLFMIEEFQEQLKQEKLLLFLFDDNGELIWDLALIELLLEMYCDLKIVGVVSSKAIGNNASSATLDACLKEARFTNLKVHPRFKIHKENNPRSCIDPACASLKFQQLWKSAGSIYLKGVAAFETLQFLPKPGFYAFVVYSSDSVHCTGYTPGSGVLLTVPPHFECFRYGDDPAWTLKNRCEHLPQSRFSSTSQET